MGDFDQNGFLDGVLVLAEVSAPDLPVAEGNPVYFDRPFVSNLPVSAKEAGVMTLNGVIGNFKEPIFETLNDSQFDVTSGYLSDITVRLDSVLGNIRRVSAELEQTKSPYWDLYRVKLAQNLVLRTRTRINKAILTLEKRKNGITSIKREVDISLFLAKLALNTLSKI